MAARSSFWALARYSLHVPVSSWISPAGWAACGTVMWITPLASTVGSAWSGSPLLRSQAAHSFSHGVTSFGCVAGVLRPLVPLSLPEPPLVPALVLVPKLATCGVLDPPLHAASARAAAATRTASAPGRRYILVISRRLPCPQALLSTLHSLPDYLSLPCLPVEAMLGVVVLNGRS